MLAQPVIGLDQTGWPKLARTDYSGPAEAAKMVGPPVLRKQVVYAKRRGLSLRWACALLKTARSGLAYESKRDAADAPVLKRMRELAAQYPRYGYRRIRIFSSARDSP